MVIPMDPDIRDTILAKGARDPIHFEALHEKVRQDAMKARLDSRSKPNIDSIASLQAVLELGKELGEPYLTRAKTIVIGAKTLLSPFLTKAENAETVREYFVLTDSLKKHENVQSLALRVNLLYFISNNRDSTWLADHNEMKIGKTLLEDPLLTDSLLVELSMTTSLERFINRGSEKGREILQRGMRAVERLPGAHLTKAVFYLYLSNIYGRQTGDFEQVGEYLALGTESVQQLPLAYKNYAEGVYDDFKLNNFLKQKEYDGLVQLLDKKKAANEKDEDFVPNPLVETVHNGYRLEACLAKEGEQDCSELVALIEAQETRMTEILKKVPYPYTFSTFTQLGLYYNSIDKKQTAFSWFTKAYESHKPLLYPEAERSITMLKAYSEALEERPSLKTQLEVEKKLNHWINYRLNAENNNSSNLAVFKLGVTENKLAKQRAEQQTIIAEQETASNRKFYMTLLGALGLLLAVIGFSFYSSRQAGQKLSAQKALVDQSLAEKEVLLREIHHRVKNNLQIISSLLQKQARIAGDSDAKRMAKEGQERIQSMALIHENLYQSEQLSGVNIRSYLEDLGANISRSHSKPDTNIKLDLAVADEHLDLDTAIPVGLILNELLTNAYKYAFPEGKAGQIQVIFQRIGDHFELEVNDNGVGLPTDHAERVKKSLGHNLVTGLVRQLEGTMKWLEPEQGTKVQISF